MEFNIARAPKGHYKKHIALLPFHGINTCMIANPSANSDPRITRAASCLNELGMFFSSSDLWKSLDPTFGKCDCMVPGKYHNARAFGFETPNLYLWCHSETGDRGTGWFIAEKTTKPLREPPSFYTYYPFESKPDLIDEIVEAFGQIAAQCALARPALCAELLEGSFVPGIIARKHAIATKKELEAAIVKPLARDKKPGL